MKTRECITKYTCVCVFVCVMERDTTTHKCIPVYDHSFMHSFLQRHESIRTVDRPLNDESFLDPHHSQRGVEIPTWWWLLLLIWLEAGWTLATIYAKYQRVLTNAALGFVSFGKILRLLPLVGSSPTTVTSNRFIQFSTEKGLCFADSNAKMCQQMAQRATQPNCQRYARLSVVSSNAILSGRVVICSPLAYDV